jgi:HAMP domain-containing protein
MGFLKGLGTTVCSILLFLALSSFSVAFLVNGTLLNTDFMNSQIDKLDISDTVNEAIEEQIQDQISQDSDFINGVVFSIVDEQEPLIKEQLHNAINEAYAYFQGKEDHLSVTISLAAIKQNLTENAWEIAKDFLVKQMADMSNAEADRYAGDIAAQIPGDMYPLSFGLDFVIEPQIESAVENYVGEAVENLDDTYVFDETTIDSGTMKSIRNARGAVLGFKVAYVYLIISMIVLAGLIFLINWKNIRASMRMLGIDLLIFGILDLAGVLVVRFVQPQKYIFESNDIPVSVQNWVNGLVTDITGIMLAFSIGVIVIGAILLAASFFIKQSETAST